MLEIMTSNQAGRSSTSYLITLESDGAFGGQAYVGETLSQMGGIPTYGSCVPGYVLLDGSIPVFMEGVFAYAQGGVDIVLGCEDQYVDVVTSRTIYIDDQPLFIKGMFVSPLDANTSLINIEGYYPPSISSPLTLTIGKESYYAYLYTWYTPQITGAGWAPALNVGEFIGWGNAPVNMAGAYFVASENTTSISLEYDADAAATLSPFDLYVNGVYVPWGDFAGETVVWFPAPPALQFQAGVSYELRLE